MSVEAGQLVLQWRKGTSEGDLEDWNQFVTSKYPTHLYVQNKSWKPTFNCCFAASFCGFTLLTLD